MVRSATLWDMRRRQKPRAANRAPGATKGVNMTDRHSEITIIGFPKCGTPALTKHYETDDEVCLLKNPDGRRYEVTWPLIKEMDIPETDRILVHKWTAYVYTPEALTYLKEKNPDSILILCIRDPRKTLVSSRNMHQRYADNGHDKTHFAYKERDFYATCSLTDYYHRFAKSRLKYGHHFKMLLELFPAQRMLVVSQEAMARDIASIAEYAKQLARWDDTAAPDLASTAAQHVGYADTARDEIDAEVSEILAGMYASLLKRIDRSGVHHVL